jgi:hypothetical protein
MDAMALLCTLHADGPATLKRLRQAGCGSIESVKELEPDRLAELIGTTPAGARRFLREAAHLTVRLDLGFLERESGGSVARAADLTVPDATLADAPAAREVRTTLGHRDQRIVEQVLESWRRRDREEHPRSHEPAAESRSRESAPATLAESRAVHEAGAADDGIAEAARAVHPDELASRTTSPGSAREPGCAREIDLRPGAIDGLDQDTCLKLRGQGIHDVESLARIDPLALSRSIGIGYTRLSRLRTLARRAQTVACDDERSPLSSDAEPASVSAAREDRTPTELKFSRAGDPTVGGTPALAQDLEILSGPKSALPAKTRWSPASAAAIDAEDAAGPFA